MKILSRTILVAVVFAYSALAADFDLFNVDEPLQCDIGQSCASFPLHARNKSVPSETVRGASGDEMAASRRQLFRRLQASRVPVEKPAFSIKLSEQDFIDIGEAPGADGAVRRPSSRKVQVGVDKVVGVNVSFTSLAGRRLGRAPHMGGSVSEGPDGELVWTALAHSKGASALRIGLQNFDLPDGAALYVYSDRGEAFGPYRGEGPGDEGYFWTNTIMGDTVTLQLHYDGPRDAASLGRLGFRIESISHIGSRLPLKDFVGVEQAAPEASTESFCSYNASCVMPGQNFMGAEDAVALIIFNSQGGSFICSGGLLRDTVDGSVIPYFLTANHCVSKGREANSVEAVFDFDTNCSDRYAQNGNYPRTNGSSIRSTSRTSDYTLLELKQIPGGSRTYLGWNSDPVAFTSGVGLFRLSHPAGAPQSYSEHSVDTSKGTCSSWPRGNWIYSADTYGATEGGSSGSPVMNASGEVVGQLSGGCGFNVGDVCDAGSNATVDGAFAAYFSAIEQFLDPDNGGGGGGCTLLGKGQTCFDDSECCSNKCKGPSGRKTCK